MIVIEQKPIPMYEVECFECKSKLQYKKGEVHNSFITCPVCGVSIMVVPTHPVTVRHVMINPLIKDAPTIIEAESKK